MHPLDDRASAIAAAGRPPTQPTQSSPSSRAGGMHGAAAVSAAAGVRRVGRAVRAATSAAVSRESVVADRPPTAKPTPAPAVRTRSGADQKPRRPGI